MMTGTVVILFLVKPSMNLNPEGLILLLERLA